MPIRMTTSASLLQEVKEIISQIKFIADYDLIIIINSLVRKGILGLEADKEIALIKEMVGAKVKVVGLYSDYQIFPEKEMGKVSIENNNLCMVLLKHERS